jgi:hypothetical protein
MTYVDPKLPDPGLGRNPSLYTKPASEDGYSPAVITAMVVAGVLVIGGVLYSMGGFSSTVATNPPPTTTGQGGAPVNPVSPRLIGPPIQAAPIDQNVPAEITSPIPIEPRIDN